MLWVASQTRVEVLSSLISVSRLAAHLGEAMDGRYDAAVVPVTLAASVGMASTER
ncbi:Uncharacterised protein [Mycolicibacterium vanbaalenii]|uniref:Uncharacterized protein n=1 Tax=Mycolicibacterium vanbaalenii TaxID=110539 RepID=A0A5S9RA62_MYCVN|nr:Uncharacterised protein [Mycolicibacterium vanbaalenii]